MVSARPLWRPRRSAANPHPAGPVNHRVSSTARSPSLNRIPYQAHRVPDEWQVTSCSSWPRPSSFLTTRTRLVQVSLIYNDIVIHVAPASAPIGNDGIRAASNIAERESTMLRTELFRMVRTVATNGLTAVASCIGG